MAFAAGLALLFCQQLLAQNTVKGKVLDQDKIPIPGAGVAIRGTTIGTITGLEGEFDLQIPEKYAMGELESS